MTIHFAAAKGHLRPQLSRMEVRAALCPAANDNHAADESQDILHAALRQFAQHGIGAASHVRSQAEQAFFAGDRATYQWWLGICRTLDRRMATNLAKKTEKKKSGTP